MGLCYGYVDIHYFIMFYSQWDQNIQNDYHNVLKTTTTMKSLGIYFIRVINKGRIRVII